MCASIHTEMKLPPPPTRPYAVLLIEPFAFAVYLEASAVDQEMQWLGVLDAFRQYRQPAAATAECGVIRNGDIDLEHIGDRAKQSLGLTERLMEHQAERQ